MAATKANPSTPATESANAKTENNARVIERVAHALEAAREDLTKTTGKNVHARAAAPKAGKTTRPKA